MSLGPILFGRFPNSLAARRLSQSVESTRRDLQRLQDQLATGQQFLIPSEAPAKALRTIVLQKTLERKQQFLSNVQSSRSLVDASEGALGNISSAVNQAKSYLLQGLAGNLTEPEREAIANELAALIQQVTSAGNTEFRGRYLFGGSQARQTPFELVGNGAIRYSGDLQSILAFADFDVELSNNVDGVTALNPLTTVEGTDLNVALTLDTMLADLHAGQGVDLGMITVELSDGITTVSHTIDLSGSETIQDLKTRIEDAFSSDALTLTVEVDPASNSGLLLTPSTGTVAVTDVSGSRVASDLGIASTAAAQINGQDLDARLTRTTRLADLNLGTGIGPTDGKGLFIVNGDQSASIDLTAAETVEDLFNLLSLANLDVVADINASGNGLSISSRLSGAGFSIGENNGSNATNLGIRTLTANTRLSDLNDGRGVQIPTGQLLEITRRDGTLVTVDVSAAQIVQDVLDALNAVDPGNLVASLNAVGNGISLVDSSGTDPLSVAANAVATSLGIAGTESGSDPTVALVGQDVNPQQGSGLLGILSRAEVALRSGDVAELGRLNSALNTEADRFVTVRGIVGTRQRTLQEAENRLRDDEVALNENLSTEFDADLSEVVAALVARQQTLQATYEAASQTLQLSLFAFL